MAREMKDSGIPWIGEIPSDWDVSTLGKFISIDSGISVGKKYEPETPLVEVPYLRVANVQGDHLDLSDVATIWVTPEEAEKYRLKPGQLLMTEGGDRDKLGRGCLWNGEIEGCIHQNHVFAVQTDNRLLVRYLDYLTTSEVARIYFDVTAKKTTNLACTSKSTIQKFMIPIPNVDKQRAISKYLDRKCTEIDAVLAKIRKSIDDYQKLKQAIITQTVTKSIRGGRPTRESGVDWIGSIPKEWACKKVKHIATISRGLFNHRPRNDERYYTGCYPFIQTGDVANASKYITTYSQTLNELGKNVSKEFPKGTLTMTIAANVGDVAILGFDAFFPDSVVGFVPHRGVSELYLFYIFKAMKEEFVRTAIKSTQLNLNIERVGDLFIPVTMDSKEQQEIVQYLEDKCSAIDRLIAKKEQVANNLEQYKKSLIYEYVTGKKEVPQDEH